MLLPARWVRGFAVVRAEQRPRHVRWTPSRSRTSAELDHRRAQEPEPTAQESRITRPRYNSPTCLRCYRCDRRVLRGALDGPPGGAHPVVPAPWPHHYGARMRMYLSSFRTGDRPEEMLALLTRPAPTAEVAVVANAVDALPAEERRAAVERESAPRDGQALVIDGDRRPRVCRGWDHRWLSTLTTVPLGSRTKNRRTPTPRPATGTRCPRRSPASPRTRRPRRRPRC